MKKDELWLERILWKFQYTKEESDMCKGELLECTETLWHECENKTIFEAWRIYSRNLEWHTNRHEFLQLWQENYTHSIMWERDFPNKIQPKATCAIGWTRKPLTLLHGSLFVDFKWMQQIGLPSSTFGETRKTKECLRSIDSFLFCYESRSHFDYPSPSFPKIWRKPKIEVTLQNEMYTVDWRSFVHLKTSRDTLDSKLNVEWNLSNIHTDMQFGCWRC